MEPVINRVAILGVGLIGGSLGLAIKHRHLACEVVGWSRHAATLRRARQRRAIDVGTTDVRRAVFGADVVVLATPVETIAPLACRILPALRPGCLLTDVGSTKEGIVRAIEPHLPSGVAFVGGHPLAGSEQRGITAARADLFERSACILARTSRTSAPAIRRLAALWRAVGARVIVMSPARHDALLAQTSHLTHLMAWTLVASTDRSGQAVAPPSFLEATRVAKSDPALWDDILLSNRANILQAMARFDRHWHALRRLLSGRRRAELLRLLRRAQTTRQALNGR